MVVLLFVGLWCSLGVVVAGVYMVSVCRLLVLRHFCLVPFLVLIVDCELACWVSVYYWRLCCGLVGLVYLWCLLFIFVLLCIDCFGAECFWLGCFDVGSLDGLFWFAAVVVILCLCLIVVCNVSCWFAECLRLGLVVDCGFKVLFMGALVWLVSVTCASLSLIVLGF